MAKKEPIMKCPHCHRDFEWLGYMPTLYKCKICGLVYCNICSGHDVVCPECERNSRVDSDSPYNYETYEVIQRFYNSKEEFYKNQEPGAYDKSYGIEKIAGRYYNKY